MSQFCLRFLTLPQENRLAIGFKKTKCSGSSLKQDFKGYAIFLVNHEETIANR